MSRFPLAAASLAALVPAALALSLPKFDFSGLAGAKKDPPPPAAPDPGEPDPRAALNDDPGLPWGVVATNSFCYDAGFRRVGTLPGGTPVERIETRPRGDVSMVRCVVLWKGVWQEREMWFDAADLILFDGASYSATDRASRDAVLDYCTAWGRYEAAKAEAESRRRVANPHAAEYEKAKAAHEAVRREVEDVLARVRYSNTHDLPGGPSERAALLARANKLRVEQRDEAAAFAAIRDRWQAWEDAHAAEPADSPKMRAAAAEMARLRPVVERIVPGL